jgi:hypothetical protein
MTASKGAAGEQDQCQRNQGISKEHKHAFYLFVGMTAADVSGSDRCATEGVDFPPTPPEATRERTPPK